MKTGLFLLDFFISVFMIWAYWEFCGWLGKKGVRTSYAFPLVIVVGFAVGILMSVVGKWLTG